MFLMMGVNPGQIELAYDKTFICSKCGKYGHYQVIMTYMCFSLFFIPIFKFSKHYYVTSTCCNRSYELDPAIGRLIRKGVDVEIRDDHLTPVNNKEFGGAAGSWQGNDGYGDQNGGWNQQNRGQNNGYGDHGTWQSGGNSSGAERRTYQNGELRCCQSCGYMTRENFEFCPKCGRRF